MNIVEILAVQVATRSAASAIVDTLRGRSRVMSFAELELAAQRAATSLKNAGLRSGDSVLVFLPMSAELYIALLAIFRLGLVAMFVDPSLGREHIEHCCAINPPRALIGGVRAQLLRFLSPALRRVPIKFAIGHRMLGTIPFEYADGITPTKEAALCTSETPALVTFTSGSTGQPRAALRTHGFLRAQHRVLEKALCLKAGEVDVTILPIFILANLASGVTSVIPDADLRFPAAIDPKPLIDQMQTHRPTRAAGSPAFFGRLADYCLRHNTTLTTLEKVFIGGGPVFPRVLERLQAAAPNAEITSVYGSTEAEPIAQISRSDISASELAAMKSGQGLIVGNGVAEVDLRILKEQRGRPIGSLTTSEFAGHCQLTGGVGEIVVRGEHVLSGYLHGHGDEETKFRVDGRPWHRTGDAGYLDSRGRLWLVGRCNGRIEDARGTIYPFMVECAAHQDEHVRRCAVVSHQGHRLLLVEAETGIDLTRLRAALAWARIDRIQRVRRIPVDKRHNSKVDYPALEKLLN